jgi:hypothetical protein
MRAGRLEMKMKDQVRYRTMESLCRQGAVFHPHESWRLLAQAEMWHHKALEEIESGPLQRGAPPAAVPAGAGTPSRVPDGSGFLAG